jgi:hypothetical protein
MEKNQLEMIENHNDRAEEFTKTWDMDHLEMLHEVKKL